ncbi:MAG TPA: amidohydrolase family protein, partial [Acetobacteraceae bacterium]|nr:amidohydrolase family protein [Acetobacteraceae bacterium]
MNVQVTAAPAIQPANTSKLAIADGDIHPQRNGAADLFPFLEQRWKEHLQTFGSRPRQAYQAGPAYPKSQPNASRRDAWPPEGGRPGSSLSFMQKQLLDENNIQLGILNATGDNGSSFQNREFGAAICHATNLWLEAEWLKEPRLRGSIVVPFEDTEAAVQEIERWAGDERFAQVLMVTRTADPPGQKRYWKIYEAAAAATLPVGVHAFGFGGYPVSGSGWPSFYIEDMVGHAQSAQSFLTSLVIEGVFARIPNFRLVLIESGFAWLPSLAWRLDKLWRRLKVETPHLTRAPSEYIRERVWLTTQPMEEPQLREHVLDAIDWIGWDRLLFATDYPHWDYDDPTQVLMVTRTADPPGQKRYWKIYEAAAAANLPVGVHAFGFGGYPVSGSGWPSFYIEDMVGHAQSAQSFLTSLV